MRNSLTLLLLLSLTPHLGCSDSANEGAGGSSSTASSGTGGGTATTSSSTGATSSGTGVTSGDGCERGLVRCGETCLDIQSDAANCGACGNACGAGEACRSRTCQAPGLYCNGVGTSGTLCGGQCVFTASNLDHCGGCDKPCAAESYCGETGGGICKPWQGHGTSCASPIVLTEPGNFSTDFWFVEGAAPMVFSCGAAPPRPTVTFRWTSDKTDDGQKFKVYGAKTDDLVIEVFSAAPCTQATSLGCNDNATATKLTPELQMAVEEGKTYFIVVGSASATTAAAPLGRFELHIDD